MKPISVQHLNFCFEHPAREEPHWKAVVERWYQLDAFAYGLAQAYMTWKPRLPAPPALILLASPQASNATDFEFARMGAHSPAKFVHTLSNIRCSSLCQVMEWAGPVLCVQRDPATQVHALREAAAMLDSGFEGPIWVLSVFASAESKPGYQAHAFVLSLDGGRASFGISKREETEVPRADSELHRWLDAPRERFPLPGGYELFKQEVS